MSRAADSRSPRWWPATTRTALALLVFSTRPVLAGSAVTSSAEQGSGDVERVADRLESAGSGDGVYGRFDGDFALSVGVGARYQGISEELTPEVRASARFYQTAGLFAGFCQSTAGTSPWPRMLELGLTLEPLFLIRFSRDAEWGRPFWDLTLDSISLSLAAQLREPAGGNLGDLSGFSLGLGLGVPLLQTAEGPWARLRGTVETGSPRPEGSFELLLEWQWLTRFLVAAP